MPATAHEIALLRIALGKKPAADRMQALNQIRARLDDEEIRIVIGLRSNGSSWAQVADALGISRQAAHIRFRHTDPETETS